MTYCFRATLILLFGIFWCSFAHAATCGGAGQLPCGQCDVTAGSTASPACTAGSNLVVTTSGGYNAVRSDPGQAAVPVDAYINATQEYCRYVDNKATAGQSIFVPFKSPPEWKAFIGNPPGYMNLVHCSRPTDPAGSNILTVPASTDPNTLCSNPNPASVVVQEPNYQRWTNGNAASWTATTDVSGKPIQFTCTNADGTTWTQTATAIFTGLDSDTNTPSWQLTSATYSGQATADGKCGSANGVAVNNPPTSGLCDTGTASAVVLSANQDYYIWTCSGTNGGNPASCSAIHNPPVMAGCYVDTTTWNAWSPNCSGEGCTTDNYIVYSAGTALGGGAQYGLPPDGAYFPDDSRYQVTWTGACNATGSGCSIAPSSNGVFVSQVSVYDTLTHQTTNLISAANKDTQKAGSDGKCVGGN